jgi:hypothetical protein
MLPKVPEVQDDDFGVIPPDANLRPLSAAILHGAIEDLKTGFGHKYADAKAFLCVPNELLHLWCSLAGIDMDAIIDRARKIDVVASARQKKGTLSRRVIEESCHQQSTQSSSSAA